MKSTLARHIYTFIFFFAITAFLYWEARYAGMTMDYAGWLERFEDAGWEGLWDCFGYRSLQHIGIGFLYALDRYFEHQELTWSFIYWFFHALNATVLLLLIKKLLRIYDQDYPWERAFAAAFLWLVCCYNAEVVIWKVCQNYFLCLLFTLIFLIKYISYLESESIKAYWWSVWWFLCSILVFEANLVGPGAICALGAIFYLSKRTHIGIKKLLRSVLPFFIILFSYFIFNYYWIGQIVGHYGADEHLSFQVRDTIANYIRYFLNYIIYWRSYEYQLKEYIYQHIFNYAFLYFFLIFSLLGFVFYRLHSRLNRWLSLLFLALFIIYLLPVANLFMMWEGVSTGGRYGYMPSAFLLPFFTISIFNLGRSLWLFLLPTFLLVNIHFLAPSVFAWRENAFVHKNLMNSYRWNDDELVICLNTPNDFQGTFMYVSLNNHGLKSHLNYCSPEKVEFDVVDAMHYRMKTRNDGVSVQMVNDTSYFVTFNQWGTWWMYRGKGAVMPIENEYYTAELVDWYGYIIRLKPCAHDAMLIYQDGPEWREVER